MQAAKLTSLFGAGIAACQEQPLNEGWTDYDDPEVWVAFSQRVDELPASQMFQSFVVVNGMRCATCALRLEAVLLAVDGVEAAQVSAASGRASVTWSAVQTRPSAWMSAGLELGYGLAPVEDAQFDLSSRQQSRLVLWRWLVAGFCMMQVMMYAAPSYFTQPGDMTPDIEKLLRWASWVLSLPVVLFSCGAFFKNAWRDLMRCSISMDLPVTIGIAVTFAASTAATFEPQGWWGREVYFDSLTMFVFFLLTGRLLEQRLNTRTAGSLGALMQRLPSSIQRQTNDGEFERVALGRLAVGEAIRVLPGEAFAVDGTVLKGSTLVDEALLTGESQPLVRAAGDQVLAGSYNLSQATLVRVDKLGSETRYAQIVALMARAAIDKPRLAVLADQVAKPFLVAVLLAACGAAAFWWQTDPAKALMAAVAVLVVTCPCALSLATPTAMLTTAGLFARNGMLVRHLQSIEALAEVDSVIFDKTGTLTEAAMHLNAVHCRVGLSRSCALQLAASLAVNSVHPVSRALVAAAESPSTLLVANVRELAGHGLEGSFGESCLAATGVTGLVRLGRSHYCGIDPTSDAQEVVLGRVYLADSRGWLATFDLAETLRADAAATVSGLRARGFAVYLLSGDTQEAVDRVAQQLGIESAQGDCAPETKLAFTQMLQARGQKVLTVGDGLNDGPALAAANVSVAVGAAVPSAQAQSDLVLPSARLLMLPVMLGQATRTLRIVKQNLAAAAIYNAIGVPLALAGFLPAWLAGLGMAMSSLLVIANAARLSTIKVAT